MDSAGESGPGIFASLRRLCGTILSLAQNRLELALVELREERWRFFDLLLLTGVVLMLGMMALTVATVTIVVLCLRAERLDLIIALGLVYAVGAVVGFWRLRIRLSNWAPFSATLTELKKDKACLEEES